MEPIFVFMLLSSFTIGVWLVVADRARQRSRATVIHSGKYYAEVAGLSCLVAVGLFVYAANTPPESTPYMGPVVVLALLVGVTLLGRRFRLSVAAIGSTIAFGWAIAFYAALITGLPSPALDWVESHSGLMQVVIAFLALLVLLRQTTINERQAVIASQQVQLQQEDHERAARLEALEAARRQEEGVLVGWQRLPDVETRAANELSRGHIFQFAVWNADRRRNYAGRRSFPCMNPRGRGTAKPRLRSMAARTSLTVRS